MDVAAHMQRLRPFIGRAEVPETELLRDVIYLLQGINGKHVGFEVVQKLPSTEVGVDQSAERLLRIRFEEGERVISPSTRHLVHRIAALGRLYRRISEFAQQQQTEETGLIKQVRRDVVAARLGPALTPAAESVPLHLLGADGLLPPHRGAGGASQPHAAGCRRQCEAS
jgi:hypothetical protein